MKKKKKCTYSVIFNTFFVIVIFFPPPTHSSPLWLLKSFSPLTYIITTHLYTLLFMNRYWNLYFLKMYSLFLKHLIANYPSCKDYILLKDSLSFNCPFSIGNHKPEDGDYLHILIGQHQSYDVPTLFLHYYKNNTLSFELPNHISNIVALTNLNNIPFFYIHPCQSSNFHPLDWLDLQLQAIGITNWTHEPACFVVETLDPVVKQTGKVEH